MPHGGHGGGHGGGHHGGHHGGGGNRFPRGGYYGGWGPGYYESPYQVEYIMADDYAIDPDESFYGDPGAISGDLEIDVEPSLPSGEGFYDDEQLDPFFDPQDVYDDMLSGLADSDDTETGEVAGLFDTVAAGLKSEGKDQSVTKALPSLIRASKGMTAFLFPPTGVPLTVGLVVADRALRLADGLKGTTEQHKAARVVLANTVKLAKKGHPPAKKAVELLGTASRVRKAQIEGKSKPGKPVQLGRLVVDGKITRGHFQAV